MIDDLHSGERQVSPTLNGIRDDHVYRYRWAAERLAGLRVADVACGIGYGSLVLAEAGCRVTAVDRVASAVGYGRLHYGHKGIEWVTSEADKADLNGLDAIVSFETIEHVPDPSGLLQRFADKAPRLLASVPNEDVIPISSSRFRHHYRHYTPAQFEALLVESGWRVTQWCGQVDGYSDVGEKLGRTIVVEAVRA